MRIIFGGLIQESNTFSPVRSTFRNFLDSLYAEGDALFRLGIDNEIAGFLRAAKEEGAEAVPTLFGQAVSSGILLQDQLELLKKAMLEGIRRGLPADGIFLALHGATAAERVDDASGDLLEAVREAAGGIPIVVSLDLHANVTKKMVAAVDGIVGYRTFPHVDFADTGYRAAKRLFAMVRHGTRPHLAYRKIPMIVPAENSQTSHGPFAELWLEAKRGDAMGLTASLFPVQPWLDVEEMGSAVIVMGESKAEAEAEAVRLANLFWAKRFEFAVELLPLDRLEDVAAGRDRTKGPVVVSDSADSPGAGATGDSNAVLRHLLARGAQERFEILLTMVDAAAVEHAIHTGVGRLVELTVGYSLHPDRLHGSPMKFRGAVRRIGDGRFRFGNGYAAGTEGRMGRCAVVQQGGLSLLLTEKPVFTGDPAMYRSMGLEPTASDIVLVKSANQFRAEYEKISGCIHILDTPGCSSARIESLPFQKLERPFYPFDAAMRWEASL